MDIKGFKTLIIKHRIYLTRALIKIFFYGFIYFINFLNFQVCVPLKLWKQKIHFGVIKVKLKQNTQSVYNHHLTMTAAFWSFKILSKLIIEKFPALMKLSSGSLKEFSIWRGWQTTLLWSFSILYSLS